MIFNDTIVVLAADTPPSPVSRQRTDVQARLVQTT
jgi:hypothetical protein